MTILPIEIQPIDPNDPMECGRESCGCENQAIANVWFIGGPVWLCQQCLEELVEKITNFLKGGDGQQTDTPYYV